MQNMEHIPQNALQRIDSNGHYEPAADALPGGTGSRLRHALNSTASRLGLDRWLSRWRGVDAMQAAIHGLALLAVAATVILPMYLWLDSHQARAYLDVPGEVAPQQPQAARVSSQPLPNHQVVLARRAYFRREAVQQSTPEAPVVSLPGLTDLYVLQGILMGDTPQAIVLDKTANSSIFVEKGQHLGNFRVVDIQVDRIILEKDNQRFELRI